MPNTLLSLTPNLSSTMAETHNKNALILTPTLILLTFFIIFTALFTTQQRLHLFLTSSLKSSVFTRPISPIDTKPTPVSENDTKPTPVSPNGTKPTLVSPNGTKPTPVSPNGTKPTPVSPNGAKPTPVLTNDTKPRAVSPNGTETTPVLTNGSEPTPVSANDTKLASVSRNPNPGFVDQELLKRGQNCNLYVGKWVRENDGHYPVYQPGSCPFVDEGFNCQVNGRPDDEYFKWRWKPLGCHLPRFNATDFLVRLRGKRLILVGDSMNRNQFESMLCLLREGLTNKSRMYEVHGYKITKGRGFYIFKFVDFNCTIEFVRSHFLVKEGVRINALGNSNPTLSIDKIDKSARKWKHADILIFNTGHWWVHGKTARGKNYFKEGEYVYPRFDAVEAYRRALKTWAKWIDKNIDPSKQLVFFRAYSSAHFRGGDWDSGGTCHGEKEPILKGTYLDNYPIKMKIVEEVIREMRVPVTLLNITKLTNFRKDGHPSIYGKVRRSDKIVPGRKQDCSHWCLPGVPDAWNELVYASLAFQQTTQSSIVGS